MKLVVIESRYAPTFPKPTGVCGCDDVPGIGHYECPFCAELHRWEDELNKHVRYARAAMKDCLLRGEAPYASHLLYTQRGVLDDTIPEERRLGMEAGFAFRHAIPDTVVYADLGISRGMEEGILDASKRGHHIEFRSMPNWEKGDVKSIPGSASDWPGLSFLERGKKLHEQLAWADAIIAKHEKA